jgi:hypothetical protein
MHVNRQRAIACGKLDLIRQEELAGKRRQRARQSRRQSELRWVEDRHPGLRVEAEQPKVPLPAEFLNSYMVVDYAVFDEAGSLKADIRVWFTELSGQVPALGSAFPERRDLLGSGRSLGRPEHAVCGNQVSMKQV